MTVLENFALGFEVALRAPLLGAGIAGALLGLFAAALPRFGLLALLALWLPVVQLLDTLGALILLAGFVCGAVQGRVSWDAAVPAHRAPPDHTEPAAAPAAPLALFIAALIGGLAIPLLAPPLTGLAHLFGPAEYVALMLLGLVAAVVLAAGSVTKSLAMLVGGMLLAQIAAPSADPASLFGELKALGIEIALLPMAVGSATLAVAICVLAAPATRPPPLPPGTAEDGAGAGQRPRWRVALRASIVGSLLGVLPGATRALAPLAAVAVERDVRAPVLSEHDERPPDPDAAHAASAAAMRSGLVPLLALGVPVDGIYALLAATLLARGQPLGPQLMTGAPELFWGVIAALIVAAPVLYLAARPMAALTRRLAALPDPAQVVLIAGLACIGLFASGGPVQVWLCAAFALLGYLLHKLGCQVAPLLLGYVLGPVLEANLRHALRLAEGDWGVFATRPLSVGLLLGAAALLAVLLLPSVRARRSAVFRCAD